jgi:hypothetical protein
MYVKRDIEASSRIIVAVEKQTALHICLCVCVYARARARIIGRVGVWVRTWARV